MKKIYSTYVDYDSDGQPIMTANEIIIEEDAPKHTGLYNHMGQPLYKKSIKQPVGFMLKKRTGDS